MQNEQQLDDPKVEERSEREIIDAAIASFPETFTLSDARELTFRIAKHQSFMRGEEIILYVQVQRGGDWKDYAKTSSRELRSLLVDQKPSAAFQTMMDSMLAPASVRTRAPSAAEMKRRAKLVDEAAASLPKKVAKPKKESRSAKWVRLASEAASALEELQSLQEEFAEWRDNLPENLQQSALGEKLETVCDLDLQSAIDLAEEARDIDLPRGFGRD